MHLPSARLEGRTLVLELAATWSPFSWPPPSPSNVTMPISNAAISHRSDSVVSDNIVASRSLQHRRRRLRLGRWQSILCAVLTATAVATTGVEAAVGAFSPQTCVKCAGLQHCTIMNGQYLFDPIAGYSREATAQLEKQGVCEDLDAKTLALSPFGTQMQFKDTAACHKLVWNFHCISWVATTFQREVNGTAVSCAKTASAKVPLPPCRSLCVEVADKCVYSHFYRMYLDEVCGNIKCLSEIQEAKNTGSTDTNIAETTCVSGSWVYAENKTFSRCSTRAYDPPTSQSARDVVCTIAILLSLLNMLIAS